MTRYDPDLEQSIARLAQIRARQTQYPGRRPGGTGLTGLLPSDAQGWSAMLNEQIEAQNIENEFRGRPPITVRPGGQMGGISPSIADIPEWWLQGEAQPTEVGPDTAARIRRNLDLMPPSLRGLYAAGLVSRK